MTPVSRVIATTSSFFVFPTRLPPRMAARDDADGAEVVGVGEGDRVGAGPAGLQEEAVVGENLHSSQAKIKVTGLG